MYTMVHPVPDYCYNFSWPGHVACQFENQLCNQMTTSVFLFDIFLILVLDVRTKSFKVNSRIHYSTI